MDASRITTEMQEIIETTFGHEACGFMGDRAWRLLAADIEAISADEPETAPTHEDAARVLRQRIGGPSVLQSYVACLVAGDDRRAAEGGQS